MSSTPWCPRESCCCCCSRQIYYSTKRDYLICFCMTKARTVSEQGNAEELQLQLGLAQRGVSQTRQGGLERGVHTPTVSRMVVLIRFSLTLNNPQVPSRVIVYWAKT